MENEKEEKEKEKELSFEERMSLKKVNKLCACGRSKRKPYCDGSHNTP